MKSAHHPPDVVLRKLPQLFLETYHLPITPGWTEERTSPISQLAITTGTTGRKH